MDRYIKTVLTVMAGAALIATPAIAQQSGETLTVEIDVFSGRPNPTFTIDAADLPTLYTKMAALCGRSTAPAVDYPSNFLGYRGVLISRSDGRGVAALSAVLARKGGRFFKSNTPAVCQGRALSAAADVVVDDPASELERHIVDIALKRGSLTSDLYRIIVKTIDSGGQ